MNPKVKQFLDEAKAKERAEFEKQRDAHLVKLGLVDEEKSTIEYSERYSLEMGFVNYDSQKDKYYKGTVVPVEVTDEEYEQIKRYTAPKVQTVADSNDEANSAEVFLANVNNIVRVIVIVSSIAIAIFALSEGMLMLLLVGVLILLGGLIVTATTKVLLNISNNLHEINSKLKDRE